MSLIKSKSTIENSPNNFFDFQAIENILQIPKAFYRCPDCEFPGEIPTIKQSENSLIMKCSKGHEYKLTLQNALEIYSKMIEEYPNFNKCSQCNSDKTEGNFPFYYNCNTKEIYCKICKSKIKDKKIKFVKATKIFKKCQYHNKELISYCKDHKQHLCSECCRDNHENCQQIEYLFNIEPKGNIVKNYKEKLNEKRKLLNLEAEKLQKEINEIIKKFNEYKDNYLARIMLDETIITSYEKNKCNFIIINNCNEIIKENVDGIDNNTLKDKFNLFKVLQEIEKEDFQNDLEEFLQANNLKVPSVVCMNQFDSPSINSISSLFNNINNINNINTNSINNNLNKINNNNNEFTKDINQIKFQKNITDNTATYGWDNYFTAFNSAKYKKCLAIYSTDKTDIECYDLDSEKIIKRINKAHKTDINCLRFNNINKGENEYIISSSDDNSIKLWDIINDWKNILTINNIYTKDYTELFSVILLYDYKNDKNFIISSNGFYDALDKMKVYDFRGNFLKEIGEEEHTFFIDTFYDLKNNKIYIINANETNIKAYDYETSNLYKTYKEPGKFNGRHYSVVMREINNNYQLIESAECGMIRIWDFYNGNLLQRFKYGDTRINGILLWNSNYLLISCYQTLNVVDLNDENGKVIKTFDEFGHYVLSIKKVTHGSLGQCFIVHDLDGNLKLFG